jgi:hypothetical protein
MGKETQQPATLSRTTTPVNFIGTEGADGLPGKVPYIAYATDENGTGFTTVNPTVNHIYIGFIAAPEGYLPKAGDYTGRWLLIQGQPGQAGAVGTSVSVVVAYADDATGFAFTTDVAGANKDYYGIKVYTYPANQVAPTPVQADFSGLWKKVVGPTGPTGPGGAGSGDMLSVNYTDGAGKILPSVIKTDPSSRLVTDTQIAVWNAKPSQVYVDDSIATLNSSLLASVPLAGNNLNKLYNLIVNLTNAAPSTLDTFNEFAVALGNDPNFATTIFSALNGKLSSADIVTVLTDASTSKVAAASTVHALKGLLDSLTSTVSGKQNSFTPLTGTLTTSTTDIPSSKAVKDAIDAVSLSGGATFKAIEIDPATGTYIGIPSDTNIFVLFIGNVTPPNRENSDWDERPPYVTGITVGTTSSSTIPLSWPVVAGSSEYRLDVYTESGGVKTYRAGYQNRQVLTNSITISSLPASTSYKIRIRNVEIISGKSYASVNSVVLTASTTAGAATAAASILSKSPFRFMRFNEALSATTSLDSSGAARNGSYVGSPTLQVTGLDNSEPANKAVQFNGTSGYEISSNTVWGTAFTIMFTVKATSTTAIDRYIYSEGSDTTGQLANWGIRRDQATGSTKLSIRITNNEGAVVLSNLILPADVFVNGTVSHVIVEDNNGTIKAWVNGVLQRPNPALPEGITGQYTRSGTYTMNKAVWGARYREGVFGYFFNQILDEGVSWKSANVFTQSEIDSLYSKISS